MIILCEPIALDRGRQLICFVVIIYIIITLCYCTLFLLEDTYNIKRENEKNRLVSRLPVARVRSAERFSLYIIYNRPSTAATYYI